MVSVINDRNEVYPKDYKSTKITLGGKVITNKIEHLEIYQDIFSPLWSCSMILSDVDNMVMNRPVKLGDEIEIKIETSNDDLIASGEMVYKFYLTEIEDMGLIKFNHYKYRIHALPVQFFNNQKTRVSKLFKNKTPDAMIGKIVGDIGATLVQSDGAIGAYTFLVPNWSPLTAIEYLTSTAYTKKTGADFLFYQSNMDAYKLRSIEKMYTDFSGMELYQVNPNSKDGAGQLFPEHSFQNMEEYVFLSQSNAIHGMSSGMFHNRTLEHDIIEKKVIEKSYTYSQENKDDKKFSPFTDSKLQSSGAKYANLSYMGTQQNLHNTGDSPMSKHNSWHGSRKSNLLKIETNKLLVSIPGNAMVAQTLGRMLKIKLPSHQESVDEKFDKYLQGDYIITAIRHIITGGKYTIFMELSKKRLHKILKQ